MNPLARSSQILLSGMRAQAERLQLVSENLANADTLGYRRKVATFAETLARGGEPAGVRVARIDLDPAPLANRFDPSSPFADENGMVALSNVDMLTEFADAREANRSYQAGLEIYQQARDMYRSLLDLLKR